MMQEIQGSAPETSPDPTKKDEEIPTDGNKPQDQRERREPNESAGQSETKITSYPSSLKVKCTPCPYHPPSHHILYHVTIWLPFTTLLRSQLFAASGNPVSLNPSILSCMDTSFTSDFIHFVPESSNQETLNLVCEEWESDAKQTLKDQEQPILVDLSSTAKNLRFCLNNPSSTPDCDDTQQQFSCLSQSCPLQSQEPPATIINLRRAPSLPNMKLQSSFEEFTPGFTGDEDDETYWFQCSSPGLYRCRLSSLVFDMKGEGDVFYKIVPWSRTLLSKHGKKPAGPLFDIRCQQQSVVQLHLPHCEIRSTGGCHFLSVAHVHDEGIEFIRPEKITETHVIISITGFSAFGNVKDEDSPPDPVQSLVLLFYKSPTDPETDHLINVLMLPKNVVLTNVLHFRKKLDEDERFLETPPHCKLQLKQLYSLSTCPGEDSVLVQPTEAEFDAESYDNYFPTFQVVYEEMMKHIKLFLKDSSSSSVWERRVCLSAAGVQKSCGSTRQNLGPKEQPEEIRVRVGALAVIREPQEISRIIYILSGP